MAATYTYDQGIAFDDVTMLPAISATGVLLDEAGGTAQQVYDLNGTPIANLTTNSKGYIARFKAGIGTGVVSFGSILQPVTSNEVRDSGPQAIAAAASAAAALVQANTAASLASQAAAAAAAAQAAAQAAAAAAAGGGGGTSLAALDTYASTATITNTFSGYFGRAIMPNVQVGASYPARPACLSVIWIGTLDPGGLMTGFPDIWAEVGV